MDHSQLYYQAMQLALKKAQAFRGATSPNPPVGAAGIDSQGRILAVAAHQKAGMPHAEIEVINAFRASDSLEDLDTIVVTLEPCNHQGRTGPCTDAIIAAGVKKIVLGAKDPNPNVSGAGSKTLRSAGIQVFEGVCNRDCEALIAPFRHHIKTGKPWITIKQALLPDGSMIPPTGQKTFASASSLKFAHGLRKRADAIITGSGTILADNPEFTIRHLDDHQNKQRYLVLLDRRKRVPDEWVKNAQARGFHIVEGMDLPEALDFLGKAGAVEVLVEAGALRSVTPC